MHAKDIIHKCQSTITECFKEGHVPRIHGINKLSNDEYRLHCESKEDPQLLSKIDWSSVFNGARTKKRKYGLVIHEVPKKDLDPTITEDEVILRDEIEEENISRNLQVVQVTPLRRTQKYLNKIAAHHSVVIFTHSAEEADECIKRGMFIKGRFYYPEKYTPELNITQYNLRKNLSRTHSILSDPSSSNYAMLIIQEQHWSEYTESAPIHGTWTLIESESYPNRNPRSAIYINNHILDTSAFRIIAFPFPDVTAVAINTTNNSKPTLVIKVYNPGDENLITPLNEYLQQNIDPSQYHSIIIAGDFNLHHPLWNPPQYHKHDRQADELIEGMLQQGMQLMIPPGTITFPEGKTAIDLVWGNEHAMNSMVKCHIATENDHGSDHLPIETILDLTPRLTTPTQPPYNFTKTDWKALKNKLLEYLSPPPDRNTLTT